MSKKDIGGIGETWAQQLAERAGIVVNRSEKDRYGWDQLWELPQLAGTPQDQLPLDLRPGRATCKVQIKSGVGLSEVSKQGERAGSWKKVKLSNWLELCHFPGPAFFLILDYANHEQDPVHMFLVHVDKDWIAQSLKNARRSRKEPHKTTQSIIFTDRDIVTSHDSLLSALERAIGPSPADYTTRKRHLVESVGYDKHREVVVCTTKVTEGSPNMYDELVQLALGLTSLNAVSMERHDNRFSMPRLIQNIGAGRISYSPPNLGPVSVRFCCNGDTVIELAGALYSTTSLAPWLPTDRARFRIVTDFFDVVLSDQGVQTFDMDLIKLIQEDELRPLQWLDRLARLSDMLIGDPSRVLSMTVLLDDAVWSLDVSACLADGAAQAVQELQVFPVLLAISLRVGIQGDVEVDPVLILRQRAAVMSAAAVLGLVEPGRTEINVQFYTEDNEIPRAVGIRTSTIVRISGTCYVHVSGVAHGPTKPLGNGLVELSPVSVRLVSCGVTRTADDARDRVNLARQEGVKWLDKHEIAVLTDRLDET